MITADGKPVPRCSHQNLTGLLHNFDMPTTVTVPDNIAFHAGPLLIGIVLNWWLFGILCVQYYLYLSKTKNERKAIKAVVHVVFILDAFQTFLMMDDAFYWFVHNYGNFSKLSEFHYSAISMALMDAIIAFIVQLFYIWRINRLSGWKLIPGICLLGSLLACGSGIFIAAADIKFTTSVGFRQDFRDGVIVWLLSSAVTDLVIALATGYLLLRMTKERPSKATGKKILRILTLTVETNAITFAVAITIVALYFTKSIAAPRTKIYLSGGYVLGKLYSNCFMILLNQRQHYHNSSIHVYNTSEGFSTTQVGHSQDQNVSAISFAQVARETLIVKSGDQSTKKSDDGSV